MHRRCAVDGCGGATPTRHVSCHRHLVPDDHATLERPPRSLRSIVDSDGRDELPAVGERTLRGWPRRLSTGWYRARNSDIASATGRGRSAVRPESFSGRPSRTAMARAVRVRQWALATGHPWAGPRAAHTGRRCPPSARCPLVSVGRPDSCHGARVPPPLLRQIGLEPGEAGGCPARSPSAPCDVEIVMAVRISPMAVALSARGRALRPEAGPARLRSSGRRWSRRCGDPRPRPRRASS